MAVSMSARPRRAGPTPSSRIWALAAASAALAALVTLAWVRHESGTGLSFHIGWPTLAVLFAVSEAFVVHVQFRRGDAHSFSLNEIPLVLGLFFAEPRALVLAQLVGAGVTLVVFRRQQPIKVVFNLGHLCLESAVAV